MSTRIKNIISPQLPFYFLLFMFTLSVSCDNEILKQAEKLSKEYNYWVGKFNTLRSELESKGCTNEENEARNLRNQINEGSSKIAKFIGKGDINAGKIDRWTKKLKEYKATYGNLNKGCTTPTPSPPPAPKTTPTPNPAPTPNPTPTPTSNTTKSSTHRSNCDGDPLLDGKDECKCIFGQPPHGCPDPDGDGFFKNDAGTNFDECEGEYGVAPDGCPKIICSSENKLIHIEKSQLCSEVLKSCTLTIRPKKRLVLEEFQVPASMGGGSLDYILKDNYGKTLFSRKDASTSSGISQFFIDRPLQADKTYKLILNPKADLSIKTYCVSNFNNENLQLTYTSKPFIKQITFCR